MRKIIFISLVIVLILIVIIGREKFTPVQNSPESVQENTQPTQTISKYKTQTNSEGEVTVEVTPISLSKDSNVQFKVVLNTHSVALDKDLKEVSILTDDNGQEYKPISWSGGVGGHHLEGILTFQTLLEESKSVKLTISEIADVNRVFEWSL